MTPQIEIFFIGRSLAFNSVGYSMALGIYEGGVGATLSTYSIDVKLLYLNLWFKQETLCLGNNLSVFGNYGIASIYYILSTFAETAG